MSDLEFLCHFYRGADVVPWLEGGRTGSAQGGKLIELIGGADNVATAERWLKVLEEEGAVQRVKLDPTRELRVFGIGGLDYEQAARTNASPCLFSFEPGPRFEAVILRIKKEIGQ